MNLVFELRACGWNSWRTAETGNSIVDRDKGSVTSSPRPAIEHLRKNLRVLNCAYNPLGTDCKDTDDAEPDPWNAK